MVIHVTKDYESMSRMAAHVFASQVIAKPDCVLGLATGSTPLGLYSALAGLHKNEGLDFSRVKTVNLDEYKGLAPDNDQSYRYFMRSNLFDHINIAAENTHVPDGLASDPAAECARYESVIESVGGIDLQLLSLGHNGHIGFNEPGASFKDSTNVMDLTQSTIDANKRFFEREEDVPRQAYTMGVGTIMRARLIVVIVSGAGKAEIVRKAFRGPVTPEVPASALQLHSGVIVIGDSAAMSQL